MASAVVVTDETRRRCCRWGEEEKSATPVWHDNWIRFISHTNPTELWRQSTSTARVQKNQPWKSDQISLHHADDIPAHCYIISKTLSCLFALMLITKATRSGFTFTIWFRVYSSFTGWQTSPLQQCPKIEKRLLSLLGPREMITCGAERIVSKFNRETPAGAEYKRSLRLIASLTMWPNFNLFASLQSLTVAQFFLYSALCPAFIQGERKVLTERKLFAF